MKRLQTESGQLTMEAVLILTVFAVLALFVTRTARSEAWASRIVEGPWDTVRGMIEDGVWRKSKDAKALHPGQIQRHRSHEGTQVDNI